MMTAISVTLKEYLIRKGDEKTSQILIGFPFNLRSRPKNIRDFYFGNEIGSCPFVMPLFTDFR